MRKLLTAAAMAAIAVAVAACTGDDDDDTATLSSVGVTPATATIGSAGTQQFTATATYSDSTTQDVSATATWTSSSANIASISSTGLATANSAGTTTITATYSGLSGTATLTVTGPAALGNFSLTMTGWPHPSGGVRVLQGTTRVFCTTTGVTGGTWTVTQSALFDPGLAYTIEIFGENGTTAGQYNTGDHTWTYTKAAGPGDYTNTVAHGTTTAITWPNNTACP